MDYVLNNETEMRVIFSVLSNENQADLLIRARQLHTDQKENKNDETYVCKADAIISRPE